MESTDLCNKTKRVVILSLASATLYFVAALDVRLPQSLVPIGGWIALTRCRQTALPRSKPPLSCPARFGLRSNSSNFTYVVSATTVPNIFIRRSLFAQQKSLAEIIMARPRRESCVVPGSDVRTPVFLTKRSRDGGRDIVVEMGWQRTLTPSGQPRCSLSRSQTVNPRRNPRCSAWPFVSEWLGHKLPALR